MMSRLAIGKCQDAMQGVRRSGATDRFSSLAKDEHQRQPRRAEGASGDCDHARTAGERERPNRESVVVHWRPPFSVPVVYPWLRSSRLSITSVTVDFVDVDRIVEIRLHPHLAIEFVIGVVA
jgi:hypothetical protein